MSSWRQLKLFSDRLLVERYYHSNFLPIAQTALAQGDSETVLIKAWAKCELCQILDDATAVFIRIVYT